MLEKRKAANAQRHGGQNKNHHSVLALLLLLNLGKYRSDEHGVLARFSILVSLAEVVLGVLSLVQLCIGQRAAHDDGLGDAEAELGAKNAQANGCSFLERHLRNAALADPDAIAAVEIAQPPFAVIKKDTGVKPADVLASDADFALIGTANLEQRGKCVSLIGGVVHLHGKVDGTPKRIVEFLVVLGFGHGGPSTNIHQTLPKSIRIYFEDGFARVTCFIRRLRNRWLWWMRMTALGTGEPRANAFGTISS